MRPTERAKQFGAAIAIPYPGQPLLFPLGKLSTKTPAERAKLRADRKRERQARRKGRT